MKRPQKNKFHLAKSKLYFQMKKLSCVLFAIVSTAVVSAQSGNGFTNLFDGKTLNGWKVGANAETFKVEDGAIVVNGKVAHLFYDGDIGQHSFKNFEF